MRGIESARAEWEADSEPCPSERRLRKSTVIDEFRRYGDALALLVWTNVCTISKLEAVNPRTGAASQLVEYLKSLADRHDIRLFGNITAYIPDLPGPQDNLLLQSQLEAWYERHGFWIHRGQKLVELWYPPPSIAVAKE